MAESGYTISDDRQSITCMRCGMTSHNPNDIAQYYCAACKIFHEQSSAPEQLPALLPAARDLCNALAVLRYPDKSTLWQLGGMPLELAYTALQRAINYEQHAPGLYRRYYDAIKANTEVAMMNVNLQTDLLQAQAEIQRLRERLPVEER
jgi:hypothetical protein